MEPVGRVLRVNVSPGGVPKLPVERAHVGPLGLAGDAHNDDTDHGGPHRAVALLAIEAIRRVAAEGHPIFPGSCGENLTTEGIELALLPVGSRLAIGERLVLEISKPDNPCSTIEGSFSDRRFARISIRTHPTDSRMYARVLAEGEIRSGDPIRVLPPAADSRALAHQLLDRLDGAARSASLATWRAAGAAGCDVRVVTDGELAFAAAPELPGPMFNRAKGLTGLPNLIERAVAFFTEHRVDVQPVPVVGRDAPGRGVRVREEPQVLERGHLVADRGRTDAEPQTVGQRFRAHRFRGLDVILNDRAEDRVFPSVQDAHGITVSTHYARVLTIFCPR